MTTYLSRAPLLTKPDAVLVALARGGDDAAFSAIVDRYSRSLHRHCRTLLRDHQAEDAVQQTFVRAMQALRSGVEVRELRPWLHRIARNVALTELASRGSLHEQLNDEWEDCSRSGEVDRRADFRAALTAIASLPDRQRTALVRSAGGESHAAIAHELGITEAAARQMLHRARTTLRTAVRVVVPPPVFWLARRAGALAERLPSPPPSIEQFVSKIAAAAAAATVVVAPASLLHASGQRSPQPAGSSLSSPLSMTADSRPLNIDGRPQITTWLPGASMPRVAGGSPLPVRLVASSGGHWMAPGSASSGASPTQSNQPGGAATTSSAGAPADPPASYPSASDASLTDTSATGTSATGPGAADPSAAIPPLTDPAVTDPAATDPTVTDPTVTDPTATDPTATAPTSTDPSTAPSSSSP